MNSGTEPSFKSCHCEVQRDEAISFILAIETLPHSIKIKQLFPSQKILFGRFITKMKYLKFLVIAITICTTISQAQVPDWAKKAVWYQIFPERFRNGDSKNDPAAADAQVTGREWHVSTWTSDWYKLQPWEEKSSGKFYDVVFDRRYGGDLEGAVDELPYLKKTRGQCDLFQSRLRVALSSQV